MNKGEWLDVWKDIQNHISKLEKKLSTNLKRFEDILREEKIAQQAREQFLGKTNKKQHNIKAELAGIQRYIQDVCSADADPKSLQGMLEKFETKLSDYKLSMRNEYNSLIAEEDALTDQLGAFAVNVGMWELEPLELDNRSHRTAGPEISDASSRVKARQMQMLEYHAKIGALDRKLANMGGRTGGWDSRDHDSFLKVLTVLQAHGGYSDAIVSTQVVKAAIDDDDELRVIRDEDKQSVSVNPQFVGKFVSFLPGKTVAEIEEHIIWHMEYMSILSEKKMILSEWRDEKANVGQGINRAVAAELTAVQELPVGSGSEKGSAVNSKFDEAALAAKREKVEQWRKMKIQEKEAEKKKEEEELAALKARADEEKLVLRQQNRLKLEQWKEITQEKKKKICDTDTLARPRSVDPASMRRRQSRDLETAKERLERKSAKHQSLNARETRLRETEKLRLQWEGPSKLHQSTKAVNAQKITPEELDSREYQRKHGGAHSARVASGGYDLKYSGRAIPAWTKGAHF